MPLNSSLGLSLDLPPAFQRRPASARGTHIFTMRRVMPCSHGFRLGTHSKIGAFWPQRDRLTQPAAEKRDGEQIMALMEVGLDDKYRPDAKRIFLSGTHALVRLPILQRERDRAQG